MFTFWDYKHNRWLRDAGLRLDHLLISPVSRRGSKRPALAAWCAARKAQATMRRPLSS
jgi:exonuclease III